MEQFQLEYNSAREDSKKSLIYTTVWLLSMLLLAFIIKFDARPDQLVDTPPLRSDEVIEEFQIDNLELEEAAGGSRGGGNPGSGRIALVRAIFHTTAVIPITTILRTAQMVRLPQRKAPTSLAMVAVATEMAQVTGLSVETEAAAGKAMMVLDQAEVLVKAVFVSIM